jgi:hypothetical protein
MKVKLAVAFAVLLSATLARADSTPINLDVTATNCLCGGFSTAPANIEAVLTVEQVTGQFLSPEGFLFTGTEYEVTSITGTLNGLPMTLAAAPEGLGSWLMAAPFGEYDLGSVYFTSNGLSGWLDNDNSWNLLQFSGSIPFGDIAINWTAVDPAPAAMPEPSTWLLLLAGIGFVLIRAVKTRKQLAG